ncbi:MAG TPA: hypothetical protein EYM79_13145 [Planctomycetes bacterium]|nr:hypothetical protein [Planctomycetaceae bacterium]HIN55247.1 hypothetical protein [Planctomycetota bacterium]
MKRLLQNLKLSPLLYVALICITTVFALPTAAQEPSSLRDRHFRDSGLHPPGQVGQGLLSRGGPIPGYFQPIEVRAPQGTQLAFVANGQFGPSLLAPTKAGMLIGAVYRMKITNIPGLEGVEVFPSIEVINRIYPPRGLEAKFAIPIQLSLREIKMAVQGFYVTRVIYLEDPTNPIPVDEPIGRQRTLDISYTEDPLHVADKLGRPVAILRIGSRYPQLNAQTRRFMFSSPPIQIIATPLLPAANTSASTTPAGFTTSASTNVAPITRAAARPISFPIPR